MPASPRPVCGLTTSLGSPTYCSPASCSGVSPRPVFVAANTGRPSRLLNIPTCKNTSGHKFGDALMRADTNHQHRFRRPEIIVRRITGCAGQHVRRPEVRPFIGQSQRGTAIGRPGKQLPPLRCVRVPEQITGAKFPSEVPIRWPFRTSQRGWMWMAVNQTSSTPLSTETDLDVALLPPNLKAYSTQEATSWLSQPSTS